MKILVLSPTFLPVVGGAEMVLFEVYGRLARRHDVRLLTPVLSASLLAQHASAEYDDRAVPFPVERYADRMTLMRVRGHRRTAGAIPPFSLSAVSATGRAIRAFRPDVLNVHYAMPTGLAALVADRVHRVPTVLTMNGRDVPGPGVPRLWRYWQRLLMSGVTDTTYVSRYCRDAVWGRRRGRGTVVYNGVENPPPAGEPERVRRDLEIPDGTPIVFTLSRLAREKRIDVLLRAMRECLDRAGAGVLVVGGTGPEAPALASLARELGIEKHVRFTGYLSASAVADHFLACDVFAFHSTFETFGLVVAQAMSYGRAVVTVDTTAVPEILGEGGLVVPVGDAAALGQALARAVGDASLRMRLGDAGRRRAIDLFRWDAVAGQYEQVLARAAERLR
jgi:glycosyltransferase involved in cell wall biosynthesis